MKKRVIRLICICAALFCVLSHFIKSAMTDDTSPTKIVIIFSILYVIMLVLETIIENIYYSDKGMNIGGTIEEYEDYEDEYEEIPDDEEEFDLRFIYEYDDEEEENQ